MQTSKEIIQQRLAKAWSCLCNSNVLMENHSYMSAMSRLYFSYYHTTRALLALYNIDDKSHETVISCFKSRYIDTDVFEHEFLENIQTAYLQRQKADYDDVFEITKADIDYLFSRAKLYYVAADEYLREF